MSHNKKVKKCNFCETAELSTGFDIFQRICFFMIGRQEKSAFFQYSVVFTKLLTKLGG